MALPLYIADAFTAAPYAGNAAAVVVEAAGTAGTRTDAWRQAVAAEMNLSETAFVSPAAGAADRFSLRWFTPRVEVDLCGHATLATAHVLFAETDLVAGRRVVFETRSGELAVVRTADGALEMDFPAVPAAAVADPHEALLPALGVESAQVRFVGKSSADVFVEVDSRATLEAIAPDQARLALVECRGVIVCAAGGGEGLDFVSRFFAPRCGIPEDPVTGSAHCTLGPHFAGQLGRSDLVGKQISARGGVVRVSVKGERCVLTGEAVTAVAGELRCPKQ